MITLRERRRIQTLKEIQVVTVKLVADQGYENVTVHMIAAEVGMSDRTFFNYYTNKEAALIGPGNLSTPAIAETFLAARNPLIQDLATFVYAHLADAEEQKPFIKQLFSIADIVPRLRISLGNQGDEIRETLVSCLQRRLRPEQRGFDQFFADITMSAMRQTVMLWLSQDDLTAQHACDRVFINLRRLHAEMAQFFPTVEPCSEKNKETST